ERRRFLALKSAVAVVERLRIGMKERTKFLELRTSAIRIQRWWRNAKLREEEVRESVIKIQSVVRMMICRKRFLSTYAAIGGLQRRWKAMAAGRRVRQKVKRSRSAVVAIQRWWRCIQTRKAYLEQ